MGGKSRKRLIRLEVVRLYDEMAKLTAPECGKACGGFDALRPNRCCSGYYCEIAIAHAKKKWGVELAPTGHPTLPLMGEGGCVAAPHLRPICAVHVCSVSNLGFKPGDAPWTARYFKIRDRLSELDSTISLEDL